MFARVKESRDGEYLQIVESYRDGGRVRQRLVLYVGHYRSIDDALREMPQDRRRLRATATRTFTGPREEALRREADAIDERFRALQAMVEAHPDLVNRDRKRAERHERQRAARNREFRRKLKLKPGDKVIYLSDGAIATVLEPPRSYSKAEGWPFDGWAVTVELESGIPDVDLMEQGSRALIALDKLSPISLALEE